MVKRNTTAKHIATLLWAILLSAVTFVFGGIPLLRFRQNVGRYWYWFATMSSTLCIAASGAYTIALAFSTIVILVGLYSELDGLDTSLFYPMLGSVFGALGYLSIMVAGWFYLTKGKFVASAKGWIDQAIEQSAAMKAGFNLDTQSIFQQLPSIIVIALVVSLVFAVIFNSANLERSQPQQRKETGLTQFYVPDLGIWLSCGALLASFSPNIPELVKIVGTNTLNILILLYFLQGLSVAAKLFAVYRITLAWQLLWYFLLTFKMFLIVAILGFADYWLDVRRWISKKMAEMN